MVSSFFSLKEPVDTCDPQQFWEVVNVTVIRELPVREFKLARLSRNARLQRAFDRVTANIVGGLEALRVDLASTRVSVTDVRPGFIRTPMTAKSRMPMPFLIDVPEAVTVIVEGIRDRTAVVAFPWQLATIVRAGSLLPAPLYDATVRRIRRRN